MNIVILGAAESGVGAALLALEYDWARRALTACGRVLERGRRAVLPQGASAGRRALGVATTVAVLVATTGITAAFSTFVGSTLV